MSGWWAGGGGPGGGGGGEEEGVGGCYQPGVYVPLKALFLVFTLKFDFLCISDSCDCETLHSNCP